jgi:hypothetical protein
VPTVFDVIETKAQDITSYLQKIDRAKTNDSLKADVYDDTIEYIKKSYLYGVIQSLHREHNFYHYMSPDLKSKLVFTLLSSYYKKFFFFFNDVIDQHFADLVFIRKVLSRLDCIIFIDNSTIVASGKKFYNLYFLYKGSVTIVDPKFQVQIAKLPEESFFGDF